jgi:hypothetical protein
MWMLLLVVLRSAIVEARRDRWPIVVSQNKQYPFDE